MSYAKRYEKVVGDQTLACVQWMAGKEGTGSWCHHTSACVMLKVICGAI